MVVMTSSSIKEMPGPHRRSARRFSAARALTTLTSISQLEKLRLLGNYGSHCAGGTRRGSVENAENTVKTRHSGEDGHQTDTELCRRGAQRIRSPHRTAAAQGCGRGDRAKSVRRPLCRGSVGADPGERGD